DLVTHSGALRRRFISALGVSRPAALRIGIYGNFKRIRRLSALVGQRLAKVKTPVSGGRRGELPAISHGRRLKFAGVAPRSIPVSRALIPAPVSPRRFPPDQRGPVHPDFGG